MAKVKALHDFEVGDKSLKTGREYDLNPQDARGLTEIGFVERVEEEDKPAAAGDDEHA